MAYTKKTWVKGSTPLSAENFNHMEQGIADAHTEITQLNSDSTFIKRESDNLYVYKNKDIAIVIAYFSISVTGGGYDNVHQLPDGVNFVNEVFAPCVILNPNWAPVGITGDIRVRNTTLTIRSSDSMENGVVVANITVPSSFVNFS